MRIAIATEYVGDDLDHVIGGLDSRLLNLATRTAKVESVTIVCSRQPGQTEKSDIDGVNIRRVGRTRRYEQRARVLDRLDFLRETRKSLVELQPDLILGDGPVGAFAATVLSGRLDDSTRVAMTAHEIWSGRWVKTLGPIHGTIGGLAERQIFLHRWDRIFAVSMSTKAEIVSKFHIRPENIRVVPNGVSSDELLTRMSENRFENPTVTVVARLVRQKRVDLAIDAFAYASRHVPTARMIIIGEGPEQSLLRSRCRELGLENRVDFVGALGNRQEYLHTISQSHLFCLLTAAEGFGLAVFETFLLGVPYLVTDLPALREVTLGGLGGRLLREKQLSDAGRIMLEMLTNPTPPLPLGERRRICYEADWDVIAARFEREIRELVP